jgi:hypothetical protein
VALTDEPAPLVVGVLDAAAVAGVLDLDAITDGVDLVDVARERLAGVGVGELDQAAVGVVDVAGGDAVRVGDMPGLPMAS